MISSSSTSQYSTCIHLQNDLILHSLTLHSKISFSKPWICCHCHEIFTSKSQQYDHFLSTSQQHYLYLFYRTIRNELYCELCHDYQYSSIFDQYFQKQNQSRNKSYNRKNSHRIIGFINMGSTCFLSSVLQVLLSNPILIRFFDLSELFIHNCKTLTEQQQQSQSSLPPKSCQLCLFCELSKLFKIVNKYTW